MGIIKPTFTLTASSSKATTDAGPLSIALSLSESDSLDVKEVGSKLVDIGTTQVLIWDASDYFTTNANMFIDGGFMYFKNNLVQNPSDATDVNHAINIGNDASNLDGVDDVNRWFTLRPGEFCWMPWDLTNDIYADGQEANAAALECWLFIRSTTVNT
tara:strand:+ start:155 stop:628 length:474 start_codon:yes stop_codon:yes gene_type:complete